MLFKTRYTTAAGFKFSIFDCDDQFDPREIRVHAPVTRNGDSWDTMIAHEVRDCLRAVTPFVFHELKVLIYSQYPAPQKHKGRWQYMIFLRGNTETDPISNSR